MRKSNSVAKKWREANTRATVLETRSKILLNEAYVTLVRAAKANGITVEELIAQRKRQARKK